MSQEVRDAIGRLLARLERGPVTLAGDPAPDRTLVDRARRHGALEVAEGVVPTREVAVPLTGIAESRRRDLIATGHELLDLTLPAIRRTRAMIRLMLLEHRRVILVGHGDDAECRALAGEGLTIIADVDEAMRLPFSPRFGIVCQSHLGSERLKTVAAAVKRRHPDSSTVVLDTRDPALVEREKRAVSLGRAAGGLVVWSDPSDPSGRVLHEAARFAGLESCWVHDAGEAEAIATATRRVIATGLFQPAGVSA
ncbi:hypothetical protein [Haloferula sargassicola]|uniref:4-hydroxy-3-methylbut-2-enyl diphosphate reductase n=1 Tax=Haloferula sargassicola TaxID=490096 RepID=A0ABP9UQN2_9BACT